MNNTPLWGRYAELRPAELAAILEAAPIAFVPWGALEWHGPHLPVGSEGFIAEAIAERAAARLGGVVLPTTWWPVAPIPHRFSIGMRAEILQEVCDGLFDELARVGFQMIVMLSGHYGFGHDLVLMDAAEHAMARHHIMILAIPPLALVDEQMLDHAGHWETALLQALRPRLVALEQLEQVGSAIEETGVIGDDPRSATAGQGESVLRLATERVVLAVRALLGRSGNEIVRELYTRRRAVYAEYVQQYFRGSWEDAIDDWWREKRLCKPEPEP